MHPACSDLHTLCANSLFRLLNVSNRVDMSAYLYCHADSIQAANPRCGAQRAQSLMYSLRLCVLALLSLRETAFTRSRLWLSRAPVACTASSRQCDPDCVARTIPRNASLLSRDFRACLARGTLLETAVPLSLTAPRSQRTPHSFRRRDPRAAARN